MEVPEQDKRIYTAVTLSNGLPCVLVSDEATERAAAALSVCVGQLQDPPNFPGLAHLVEHMLFLGTEEFPVENEYDKYLSQHGGHSNAYTDLELTCYYCDCQVGALEGALQRFAACLKCPLLNEDALEREIQAVDSEHANNRQQDNWRTHQMSRSIWGHGYSSDREKHPYGGFGSGNVEVLLPGSEEKASRIKALREQVVAFYDKYYKASNMKLVVIGQNSTEELQNMAETYFGKVPVAEDGSEAHIPTPLPPLLSEPRIIHYVPVREGRRIEMQWVLPEQRTLYRSKPARYFSHLIGHEGPKSLLQVLRELHWAQELSADDVSKTTSAFTIFAVQIELTEEGMRHVDDVIRLTYASISLLKDIPIWVFDELKTTADMQFRFLSKQEASDTACDLVVNMQHFDPEHYLSGSYKVYEHDPSAIQSCYEAFKPENMLVLVGSSDFEGLEETDPWYGTQFKVLTQSEVHRLSQEIMRSNDDLASKIALPEPNDMIATDFDLVTPVPPFTSPDVSPMCIADSSLCRLWYKPDTVFAMPKVNVMLLIRSPLIGENPRNAVLGSLWAEIVHEFCNEFSYVASMAGLHCDFSSNHSGIEITISGYNHKVDILLKRVVHTINRLPSSLDSTIFDRIKEKLEKRYVAFLVGQPYQHGINLADQCMETSKWSVQSRLESLQKLMPGDVMTFQSLLLDRFFLEGLIHGNVTAEAALSWISLLLDTWKPSPLLNHNERRVTNLPLDSVYHCKGWNPENQNSAVVNIFQIGPIDLRVNACLSIFSHLVQEPAFNQLRTEEQLGYIVHTGVKTSGEKVKSLMMLVQSESFDPHHIDQRIEAFLQHFRSTLLEMSSEDFKLRVDTVVQILTEKNKNLIEESSKHWQAISSRVYNFKRLVMVAEEAKGLTKDDVMEFMNEYIIEKAPRRAKLSIQIYGKDQCEKLQIGNPHNVESPEEFRRSHPLYPLQPSVPIDNHRMSV